MRKLFLFVAALIFSSSPTFASPVEPPIINNGGVITTPDFTIGLTYTTALFSPYPQEFPNDLDEIAWTYTLTLLSNVNQLPGPSGVFETLNGGEYGWSLGDSVGDTASFTATGWTVGYVPGGGGTTGLDPLTIDDNGQYETVMVLGPVPEGGTLALLLIGVGFLGGFVGICKWVWHPRPTQLGHCSVN
jgi:hypothetical protein